MIGIEEPLDARVVVFASAVELVSVVFQIAEPGALAEGARCGRIPRAPAVPRRCTVLSAVRSDRGRRALVRVAAGRATTLGTADSAAFSALRSTVA